MMYFTWHLQIYVIDSADKKRLEETGYVSRFWFICLCSYFCVIMCYHVLSFNI